MLVQLALIVVLMGQCLARPGRAPGRVPGLLVRVVTDPDWQAASPALDDLMGKLLVVRRLLEAEERLPKRESWTDPM